MEKPSIKHKDQSLTTPQVINALEEFRKKHPGRLKIMNMMGSTWWVEPIKKFELRDKIWREPSVITESRAILKFSEVYSKIFIEDYYEESCPVLRYDNKHPDEVRYYLNVPLHLSRDLHKGDVMVAYLSDRKPHLCNMSPHHSLITYEEDMETLYSARTNNDILTGFSQGLRFIANRFIYPSGHISDLDPDDMYGYVTTLIIL